ncbi:LytTR family transcriptional regulator DNA-binding domain-containing protein [Paenibacillus farraposensis]|uniref:LytTR family transcriptional regulator DNA-binding domain-containing protein n=1 Tax=Paenibacillus farraposensis TaxID=2807095 RepID=A0ABW4DM03_9BACL|nr:LytTR family transcriptional regulator DNA-binding domain-containing protein [Paenibacillus farraposensis]MCC3381058.1 LytTR family transcriptional regulator DNA-binding domain-containing protein [Paenibacillus farraposensis]
MENRQIFAPEILSSGDFGNRYSFFENDLVCVERWIPKSNYEIPFFITTDGNFTAPTTHGEFADGFPDFISLDSGNLVNLKNVSRSETGEYGGKVYFRGDKHTSVNKLNSVVLTELMEAANKRPDDQRFIIGTCNSKAGLYPTKDIFFLDMWDPKKNYHVPRLYHAGGFYVVALTMRHCQGAFPYLYPATPSHLINVSKVAGFDEHSFGITVTFKDTDYTCPISKPKHRALKKILRK